ncbi:hypothetical protein B0H10DRAFT_2229694 [Mycena sp. CBHHK59/15]|nr:hypothetical protein B0H10DRAFT_2229694 [Mycena sp. CBHHK59/15]
MCPCVSYAPASRRPVPSAALFVSLSHRSFSLRMFFAERWVAHRDGVAWGDGWDGDPCSSLHAPLLCRCDAPAPVDSAPRGGRCLTSPKPECQSPPLLLLLVPRWGESAASVVVASLSRSSFLPFPPSLPPFSPSLN